MRWLAEPGLRRLFRASLWIKGAHAAVEVLGGVALLLVTHAAIIAAVNALTWVELMEDPGDLVANALRRAAAAFTTDGQTFAAWYLLSHGIIKLGLVAAVLAERLWAYPAFIVATAGFILYQVYLMRLGVTVPLVAITVLDVVVLALAWHEYRLVKR